MGLNDSYYAMYGGQILLIQPLPTIGNIYSMIFQEKQCDLIVSREVLLANTQSPLIDIVVQLITSPLLLIYYTK